MIPQLTRRQGNPHPLRCILAEDYFNRHAGGSIQALRDLIETIGANNFAPYHSRESIDTKFSITCNKFTTENPPANLSEWKHLVGTAMHWLMNRNFLRDPTGLTEEDLELSRVDFHSSMQYLKIIEDWLYYHAEARSFLNKLLETQKA